MHRIFIEKSTKVSKEKGTRPLFIRGFCSIAEKDKKNEKNSKKVLHKWSFCCIIYERWWEQREDRKRKTMRP